MPSVETCACPKCGTEARLDLDDDATDSYRCINCGEFVVVNVTKQVISRLGWWFWSGLTVYFVVMAFNPKAVWPFLIWCGYLAAVLIAFRPQIRAIKAPRLQIGDGVFFHRGALVAACAAAIAWWLGPLGPK